MYMMYMMYSWQILLQNMLKRHFTHLSKGLVGVAFGVGVCVRGLVDESASIRRCRNSYVEWVPMDYPTRKWDEYWRRGSGILPR